MFFFFSEAPKVHFHAEQLPEHESEIVIRPESENSIAVPPWLLTG